MYTKNTDSVQVLHAAYNTLDCVHHSVYTTFYHTKAP